MRLVLFRSGHCDKMPQTGRRKQWAHFFFTVREVPARGAVSWRGLSSGGADGRLLAGHRMAERADAIMPLLKKT